MTTDRTAAEVERETVSVEQAARILGIGRNKAHQLIQDGHICVVGLPGCRL
jgi:transposase-like protein